MFEMMLFTLVIFALVVCALFGYQLGLRDGSNVGYQKGYREGFLRSAQK